jgi:hypothetical protein
MLKKAQWSVSGIVEAPVDKVWEALVDVTPGLPPTVKDAIAHQDETRPFTTTVGKPGESRIKIEVEKQQHSIAIEGEWWYRGVYSVETHQKGSLLVYSVYNIAPGSTRWMAQLVQGPQHARTMNQQLEDLLKTIGSKLHCAVYLNPK